MEKGTVKIIQLIPAENWWATFFEKNEKGLTSYHVEPLACWALVEHREGYSENVPSSEVRGITGHDAACGDFAENVSNFMGYVKASTKEEAIKEAMLEEQGEAEGPV